MDDLWSVRTGPTAPAAPKVAEGEVQVLTGTVESVVFRNEDTDYTVCSVRVADAQEAVTVVGKCAAVWEGESLKAEGKWVRHRQHGRQFQADSIVCVAPTTAEGIERYLGSGVLKGIGKVLAHRIVRKFGADTLRVLTKESARLREVPGIGESKHRCIKESWDAHKAEHDIMVFLRTHGVGAAHSHRILKQYGDQAVALISENPYRLCGDIWGIGFKTADGVARSLGLPPQSEARARAGLVYVLETMAEEGHCFCPAEELLRSAAALLEIPEEVLDKALHSQVERKTLIRDRDRIYLPPLHHAEVAVAGKIRKVQKTPPSFPPIAVDRAVPWAEKKMRIAFAPRQAEALRMAMSEKVSIITGGPGVGKTTIIRALVEVFAERKLGLALAAPTGRAAKRMEEATGRGAKTIHRLLKYQPQTRAFLHGPGDPLEEDVYILDEVSMMDIELMSTFLGALPAHGCLILVGDVDQLPSVGPGNVLRDLIESGSIPFVKLDTIFRQEATGSIVQNAHRVNQGLPIHRTDGNRKSDFYFVECEEPDQVVRAMVELVARRIPDRMGFRPLTDIQVLTPMRRNQLGADNLNAVLQEALNPAGPSAQRFGRHYRVGDRVMQIRNNYEKGVFNGDIGLIRRVDEGRQIVLVDFDGRSVNYEYGGLDELVHAYACTVHKAQGSEYPAVVVLMTTQHYKMLQRNLLYTAITRGRKLVCLVGSSRAVHIAIRNDRIQQRRTGLKDRLVSGITGTRYEPVE